MATSQETGKRVMRRKTGSRQRRSRQVSAPSGAKLVHVVSFGSARVEATMKESGVTSPSELGILALAALAQPDPVATFMRRNRGRLGKDHKLDC